MSRIVLPRGILQGGIAVATPDASALQHVATVNRRRQQRNRCGHGKTQAGATCPVRLWCARSARPVLALSTDSDHCAAPYPGGTLTVPF